jgi:prepilin-type N-terminal cleavage/methylation domain-containing protein
MKTFTKQGGFTLIEFIVVMGIFAVISSLIGNSLLTSSNHASLDSTVNTFIADLRQQQLKAMVGDTQGLGQNNNYGVYFKPNAYVLFTGSTYQSTGSANFSVSLPGNTQFANILFPSSQVVFLQGSGEVQNYLNASSSVALKNTYYGTAKTITLNRYGVVTGIN